MATHHPGVHQPQPNYPGSNLHAAKLTRLDRQHVATTVKALKLRKGHNSAVIPHGAPIVEVPRTERIRVKSYQRWVDLGFKNTALLEYTKVLDEKTWPWWTIGMLQHGQTNSDVPIGWGTGLLVGTNVVLTAAHVIPWSAASTTWLKFIPAFNASVSPPSMPFGGSFVTEAYGYAGQEVSGLDYAVCRIQDPLGDANHLGCMGDLFSTGDDFYENGIWRSVGYPRDGPGGPVVQEGVTVEDVDQDGEDGRLLECLPVFGAKGWSGGPLWQFWQGNPDDPRVVAVLGGSTDEFNIWDLAMEDYNGFGGGPAMNELITYARHNWV